MKQLLPLFARFVLVALLLGGSPAFAQGKRTATQTAVPAAAREHLQKNQHKLGLEDQDLADLTLSSETESPKSGTKHLYVQQHYEGIEVYGALTTVTVDRHGQVVSLGNRLHRQVSKKVKTKQAALSAAAAVTAAANHLQLALTEPLSVKEKSTGPDKATLFSTGGMSLEPIPAKLVYQPLEDGSLVLAWEVAIYELDAQSRWSLRLDAANGQVLAKHNQVVHCEFDYADPAVPASPAPRARAPYSAAEDQASVAPTPAAPTYNVFALPLGSPSEGPRSLVSHSVADKVASPSGWHSTGTTSYTITRGNNVLAYEDPGNNNNVLGMNYSPDGGAALNFDFPLDLSQQPVVNRDAAITNLFYWNNLMHDVWYRYGFDEQSGNFQTTNFHRGPADGELDHVRAEAQDSRDITTTRNNANFFTPPDGQRPRMQMYLFGPIVPADMFQVTAPAAIARSYPAAQASFGPRLGATPVTSKLVLAEDAGDFYPAIGCGAITNAAALKGNIAVMYWGPCEYDRKVYNAQVAGAVAVIIIYDQPQDDTPFIMRATASLPGPITIPAVMISNTPGVTIREKLDAGVEVSGSLKDETARLEIDSDFDNLIIAHEYGHGISLRLTGGRERTDCLNNAEQMGEGWSDWFGLMMTIKEGDRGSQARGMGAYASGQLPTARGFRRAPYSTDFSVNSFTYAATNNPVVLLQPHGIGFMWATMLWDMTWDLIAQHGFDPDLYDGNGGNNLAMQLVIDGLKLQPCSPGFVDGRDAILLADRLNYGGAHQALIWGAFAKRGLGFSASQGSSASRFDQVQAFDLPPTYLCATPLTVAAVATSPVFTGGEATTVYLGYGPQSVQLLATGEATNTYSWAPATGLSDATAAAPVFTPTAAGTYTFTVTAVNKDQCTKTVAITIKVVDVVCGNKGNKVQVCFKGKGLCVDAADTKALLARGEATLGSCPRAKAAVASAVASDALLTNDGLTAAPNPTNANTTLAFTLAESGAYRLEVMNMQGAVVAVVAQGKGEAGQRIAHEFSKGRLATGVYMVRLTSGKQSKFTRVVLQD
ncbi:T9SS-dependent M36 family metallopeptidase [Hymenobacter sp. HD11105]